MFWANEKRLGKVALDAIKGLEKIAPYDLFAVQPQSYNLSIEKDRTNADQDRNAK